MWYNRSIGGKSMKLVNLVFKIGKLLNDFSYDLMNLAIKYRRKSK